MKIEVVDSTAGIDDRVTCGVTTICGIALLLHKAAGGVTMVVIMIAVTTVIADVTMTIAVHSH